jgi:hypothetical protein
MEYLYLCLLIDYHSKQPVCHSILMPFLFYKLHFVSRLIAAIDCAQLKSHVSAAIDKPNFRLQDFNISSI